MAIIPLNQKVKISKHTGSDSWGKPTYAPPVEYYCRFEESSEKVVDQNGDEFIPYGTVYLEGLQDVDLNDLVEYENEIGDVYVRKSGRIKILRDISGNPLFTVLYLK